MATTDIQSYTNEYNDINTLARNMSRLGKDTLDAIDDEANNFSNQQPSINNVSPAPVHLKELLHVGLTSFDPIVQIESMMNTLRWRHEVTAHELDAVLNSKNEYVRSLAVQAFGRFEGLISQEQFNKGLLDVSPEVRAAYAKIKRFEVADAQVKADHNNPIESVR